MALPRLTDDLNIIQQLPDEPNTDLGMSPAELKAEFDEAGNKIKAYINSFLIEALESSSATSGAMQIGAAALVGGDESGPTVQDKLAYLLAQMQSISQGSIPDGTITNAKLADNAVTAAKILDNTITPQKLTGSFELGYAGATAGTPPAYTATKTGFTLVDGAFIVVKCHASQSAASTLNVNSLGAKPLKAGNGTDVLNMVAGGIYSYRYNATSGNFILQGSDSSGNATAATVFAGKGFANDAGPGQMGAFSGLLFNCVNGGNFDFTADQSFWNIGTSGGSASAGLSTAQAKYGSYSVRLIGDGTNDAQLNQIVRLRAGRSYYCAAWIRRTGTAVGQFDIVNTGGAELDISTDIQASTPAADTWTLVSGIVTAALDADASIRVYNTGTGTVYVDGVFMQDMAFAPGITKAEMDMWYTARAGNIPNIADYIAYHQTSAQQAQVLNQVSFLYGGTKFAGSLMGGVKSIQHGYSQITGTNTSLDITLSTVDMTKSIVMIREYGASSYECNEHVMAKLTTNTNLNITRNIYSVGGTVNFDWYVIEYANVKSRQVIEVGVGANTIAAVDPTKTLVFWSVKLSSGSDQYKGLQRFLAYLSAATTITTAKDASVTLTPTFCVQVIEFY